MYLVKRTSISDSTEIYDSYETYEEASMVAERGNSEDTLGFKYYIEDISNRFHYCGGETCILANNPHYHPENLA